jgi:hypothetical protein
MGANPALGIRGDRGGPNFDGDERLESEEETKVFEGKPNPTVLAGFGVPGAEGGSMFIAGELKYGD